MPEYNVTCGDGNKQGNETCDDGDTESEGCGNATLETAGSYCNSTCTSIITISSNEVCDYSSWSNECYTLDDGWYTTAVVGKNDYCSGDCLSQTDFCSPPP